MRAMARVTRGWSVVAAVAMVGCGGSPSAPGADAAPPAGDGALDGGGGAAGCAPAGLRDDFSAPALDDTAWRTVGFSGWTPEIVDGRLALTPRPEHANTRTGAVIARAALELTGCAIWLELPRVLPSTHPGEVTVSLSLAGGGSLGFIRARQGSLQVVLSVTGAPAERLLPYDAVAHRWWRFREASGELSLETSPDAQTWTTQAAAPHGADVSAVTLMFGATETSLASAFDAPLFDNVNVAP